MDMIRLFSIILNSVWLYCSVWRRAFYGLQSAGLCTNGVTPDAAGHMIRVAIQPVLVYGCATININPGAIKSLEKTQGRSLRAHLGYQNTAETRLYSEL